MAMSGYTKDLPLNTEGRTQALSSNWGGYILWNDKSVSFYDDREIAKKELRRDVNKNRKWK